jgi:prephenate dehydratase
MTKTAYLGIPGSFSYAAAQELAPGTDYMGVPKFGKVFLAVEGGAAQQGVVPIENSLAGSVYDVYDLLGCHDVHVTGEHYLPVAHFLLGVEVVDLASITDVHSHPKALEQCTELFAAHPQMRRHPVSDTAAAAKLVSEQGDTSAAAISSQLAGELYGLKVLAPHVEDDPDNYTRFLRIASAPIEDPDADKCSVILRLLHEPGSLCRALGVLAGTKCNLTRIESRPLVHGISGTERPTRPEYIFYLDFEYGRAVWPVATILDQLEKATEQVKVLGCYKQAELTLAG